MELELGFKITKTLDNYSSTELRISKDQSGPVFVSRETDTMFVLNAHLKGYKKELIQIEINEDGSRIAISGERQVQEMVMVKWQMHKKEPEIRGFKKVFNIPEGVKLDKIKARFNEDESVLTISMPKLVKGLGGLKIGEITTEEPMQKENDNVAKENDYIVSEISPSKENENGEQVIEEANDIAGEVIPRKETEIQGLESDDLEEKSIAHQEQEGQDEEEKGKNVVEQQISPSKENENGEQVVEEANDIAGEVIPRKETEIQGLESDDLEEKSIAHQEQEGQDEEEKGKNVVEQQISPSKENENGEQVVEEANDIAGEVIPRKETEIQGLESDDLREKNIAHQEQVEEEKGNNVVEQQASEEGQSNENVPKLCVPMIAGAAFIVSLIVFVVQMVRSKNAPSRKKS